MESISDTLQSFSDAICGGGSKNPLPPLARAIGSCTACTPQVGDLHDTVDRSVKMGDTNTEVLKFRKLEDKPPEWYLMEYSDDYLIQNACHRKLCILCILLLFLPGAYFAGFYVGGGLEKIMNGRENATALALSSNDTVGNSDDIVTPTNSSFLSPSPQPIENNPSDTNTGEATVPQSLGSPSGPSRRPTPTPVSSLTLPTTRRPTPLPSPNPTSQLQQPWIEIVWNDVPESSTHTLESGPLVGHVSHHSVKLWAWQGQGQVLQVVYRKAGDNGNARSIELAPNAANDATILVLGALEDNTAYDYEIRIENERVANGQFRTAPAAGKPTEFDYLLASCMNVKSLSSGYPDQPVWDVIRSERPQLDMALLVGDNVYLNDGDWTAEGEVIYDRIWHRHFQQRREAHFANFIANVPTYATWDDHDYGKNDADRRQLGKEKSLDAFQNIWANPSYGIDDAEGVFYTFSRGDVQFLVMDNRWYRGETTGSQFGAAQLEWLLDQLRTSTAVFKIIVSASDLAEEDMDDDLMKIGDFVAEYKIPGVIFNAGDIHRNEYKTFPQHGNWPYRFSQFSSSGIARVWRRPFALINVNTKLADPTITASFYGANNTSLDTFWTNDPSTTCSGVVRGDRYNEHRCTQVIRLSDLTPA